MFIGPLAVGCSLGLVSFASAGLVPGYDGAGLNPARCFAFAVARGGGGEVVRGIEGDSGFRDQWIWWLGDAMGGILLAGVMWVAPPYHSMPVEC